MTCPSRSRPPTHCPQLPFANQVALLGLREGWGEAYMRETYRRWFVDGKRPGEDPNLSDSLAAAGVDPDDVMARARAPEIEAEPSQPRPSARNPSASSAPPVSSRTERFSGATTGSKPRSTGPPDGSGSDRPPRGAGSRIEDRRSRRAARASLTRRRVASPSKWRVQGRPAPEPPLSRNRPSQAPQARR
jgi:hypothetical protein